MIRPIPVGLVVILLSLFLVVVSSSQAYARAATDSCAPVEFAFARGSGDTNGASMDMAADYFHDNIVKSLESLDVNYHEYYVGSESYGGYQYPHVAINGSVGALMTSLGAKVSSGDGFSYGLSVKEGTRELKNYLDIRMSDSQCPDSHFIIGGFSQGAQVVGETLFKLTDNQLNKIAYVALFGDPKLNLPEGNTYTYGGKLLDDIRKTNPEYAPSEPISPDACYGVNTSPWRTMIDNCHAYAGQLGARSPYVPKSIESRVHLWCHQNDGICDSTQSVFGDGHSYTDEAGIHMAVNEALFTTGIIPASTLINLNDPNAKFDLSFVIPINCTPLFRFPYPIPQLRIPRALRDLGAHSSKLRISYEVFQEAMNESTIQLLNDNLRPGAQQILYYVDGHNCLDQYVGDGYSPRLQTQRLLTTKSIESTSTKTSNWDPIILTEIKDDPTICALTSNSCIDVDTTSTGFELAKLGITESPRIAPLVNSYTSSIGQPTTYSVKTLPDNPDYYDSYDWDFDADGQPDATTSEPTIQHTYENTYDGNIIITATDISTTESTSTTIHQATLTEYTQDPLPIAPQNVAIKKTGPNEVYVTWESSSSAPGGWMVRVNGFPLGRVTESQHYLTISDVDFSSPVTVSVTGLSTDYSEGEPASATIEPDENNNSPDLSRRGSDVDKLITAYELGNEVPNRTIDLSDGSSFVPSPTTDAPNTATQTQQKKTMPVHGMNPLYLIGLVLIPLVIVGSVVLIMLKIKK